MPAHLAALALLLPAVCTAQPIATDRPDFTEGTQAMRRGQVQVEAGATLSVSGSASGRETDLSGVEALLRVGLGRGLEARLTLPDVVARVERPVRLGDASVSGGALGLKAELGRAAGLDLATIVDVSLSDDHRPSPRAVVMLNRDVSAAASVAGQVEAAYDPDAQRVLPAVTLVGGLALGRGVATFAEVAVSDVGSGPAGVVLHHGYTLALGEALQVDLHGGVGLTETALDVFVGAGVGVRL